MNVHDVIKIYSSDTGYDKMKNYVNTVKNDEDRRVDSLIQDSPTDSKELLRVKKILRKMFSIIDQGVFLRDHEKRKSFFDTAWFQNNTLRYENFYLELQKYPSYFEFCSKNGITVPQYLGNALA